MIKKILVLLREKGPGLFIRYIWCKIIEKLRCFFVYPLRRSAYRQLLEELDLGDRVLLWVQEFGWNVELYQRPQHIAKAAGEQGTAVFYYTTCFRDPGVTELLELYPRLYLVNAHNRVLVNTLEQFLEEQSLPKYLHLYSTNFRISLEDVRAYESRGFDVLYEYIDDLAPEISGTAQIPRNIREIFDYVTGDSRIPMTVTADALREHILSLRGEENLAFSTNGVDADHFRSTSGDGSYIPAFQQLLDGGRPMVGYYGAVAAWFDYKLLAHAAKALPDTDFVLLGKIYDDTWHRSGLAQVPNVHFLGAVSYADIPRYARHFRVCTIPFLVNDITNATSPLKLFEYMALGKPILTTDMRESRKYTSVHTAKDREEFVKKLRMLLAYAPEEQPEYYAALAREAEENTWRSKTCTVLTMLKEHENRERH